MQLVLPANQRTSRTIENVLENLPPDDARRIWWENIRLRIEHRDYWTILRALWSHHDDDDFCQQVEVIANEITRRKNDLEMEAVAIIAQVEANTAEYDRRHADSEIAPFHNFD